MKQAFSYKTLVMVLFLSLVQAVTWAQDSGSVSSATKSAGSSSSSSTTTTTTTEWYTQPWVWIVGGAVLLLLIVALVRGNSGSDSSGRTDKVTVTKSIKTDTDI